METLNLSEYGPFANVVAVALALVATFSMLLLKTFGRLKRWTWLAAGSPPFIVTAAARAVVVAFMAATYVTITKSNYRSFGMLAILSGVVTFAAIARFDWLRKIHVLAVPLVGKNGEHVGEESVVVGLESNMRPQARKALVDARKANGALSLRQFMSGYGSQRVNDPEAIWDRELLAGISTRLMLLLMSAVLFGVLALFWSAFVIEVFNR